MFVCEFDIKISCQFAVEEHYFHIEETDFVVGKGVNLIGGCRLLRYVMKSHVSRGETYRRCNATKSGESVEKLLGLLVEPYP